MSILDQFNATRLQTLPLTVDEQHAIVNALLHCTDLHQYEPLLIAINDVITQEQREALWQKLYPVENHTHSGLISLFPLPHRYFLENPNYTWTPPSLHDLNRAWNTWSDIQRRQLPDTYNTAKMLRAVLNASIFFDNIPEYQWQCHALKRALLEYTLQEIVYYSAEDIFEQCTIPVNGTRDIKSDITYVLYNQTSEKIKKFMQPIYDVNVPVQEKTSMLELAYMQCMNLYQYEYAQAKQYIDTHLNIRKNIDASINLYSLDDAPNEPAIDITW